MKLSIIGLLTVFSITGCETLTVDNFDRAKYSAIEKNISRMLIHNKSINKKKHPLVSNNAKLMNLITTKCKPRPPAADGASVSATIKFVGQTDLIAATGKLLYDLYIDKKTKNLKKLKKAASSKYSNKVIMSSKNFKDSSCVLLYRINKKKIKNKDGISKYELGIVTLLKLRYLTKGFTMQPIFVRAHNTSAITKKYSEGKYPKINVTYAVSLKAIGVDKDGLPVLKSFGEGVVSVVNVEIDKDKVTDNKHVVLSGKISCIENDCDSSDLIPYHNKSENISVSFAVTESGKLGVSIDEKLAEAATIKEAIGPAIKDMLLEYLKDE